MMHDRHPETLFMDRTTAVHCQSSVGGSIQPADIIRILRTHVRWWAIPTVVCAVVAAAYSLAAPRQWRASQALIVRPEAASVSDERLGKFTDLSEMKTLQETILELAKSQSVVQATLRAVGPPRSYRHPDKWPTQLDVEDFRDVVDMRPPGGAEFGKTEVFYISIRSNDRNRAGALVAALCTQLEARMQELRDQRAQSMIAELQKTVAMADGDLATQTARLSTFEAKIGADLSELRNLNADVGSQGEVAQQLQAIDAERRANEARHRENQRLLRLLVAAEKDPAQLLATPNTLLVSQPAVSQLKNALVNAQVRTANLLGTRAEQHPFVVAARESEQLIRAQLNSEIGVAIRGLEVDIELNAEREVSLTAKWNAARARQSRLAESRAEYASIVASVQNHTRLVEAARKNLADARARQAGAHSASVISRIDGVETGVRPIGPGRKVVVAGGGMGGLILGLGVVFLFASPVPAGVVRTSENHSVDAGCVTAMEPTNVATRDAAAVAVPAVSSANGQRPAVGNPSFGLFRGMTLQDAIRSVEQQRRR
jgi:uncharacterized protein involved in exopolysaccharide biosynthesis